MSNRVAFGNNCHRKRLIMYHLFLTEHADCESMQLDDEQLPWLRSPWPWLSALSADVDRVH